MKRLIQTMTPPHDDQTDRAGIPDDADAGRPPIPHHTDTFRAVSRDRGAAGTMARHARAR